jgi:DNA-binding MarR family transcriptional regulator
MPEPDIATLTHRLAALTRRAIGDRMAHESWAHEAGFRPGCIGVLHVVAAKEPVSQREVSDALLLDPSDLVTLVDILERAGLLERRRDPADRRRYALEVTPQGQLAVVRLREINREANEELLAPLDADERAQLAGLLTRVVHHHTGHPADDAAAPLPDQVPAGEAAARDAALRAAADRDAAAREVAAHPVNPERAPEPYDPDREAERARESLRP